MINRILIRIKVVQTLYSFLLTHNDFTIEQEPQRNTRDSRFANQAYNELLSLILEFSTPALSAASIAMPKLIHGNPLAGTKMAFSLYDNSAVKSILSRRTTLEGYQTMVSNLFDRIVNSAVVADFSKRRKRDLAMEVQLWNTLLDTVIANDRELIDYLKKYEDFTLTGFRRGINMLKGTLSDYQDSRTALGRAKKMLDDSLEQARLLYFAFLRLPVEIVRVREEQIETAKEKYLPSADDLNPNMRFINSPLVKALAYSPEMEAYFKAHPYSWDTDYFLIKKLLDDILASDIYKEYISRPESFADDCEFWREVFKSIIFPSDELAETLESKSVYWNDDTVIMGTFILKSLRQWANDPEENVVFLPKYKDEEDERFGNELFGFAASEYQQYRELIEQFIDSDKWDSERIAFMDIVILVVAIAEIIHFPKVPVPVTMNEYIEIANSYSTQRSGQFINGILTSIVTKLRNDGTISKTLD